MSSSSSSSSSQQQQPDKPVIRSRSFPSRRRRDGLIRYARDRHSQNGEDGILERLFALLPPAQEAESASNASKSATTTRWCVDVGAWDGKHLSNTCELLFNNKKSNAEQWRGILLEADPERFQELQERNRDTANLCLNVTVSANSSDDPHNLCNVVKETAPALPHEFDFLCIDIDGADYWVLHDLWSASAQSYHPSVVCVEFNPTMPNSLIYIPPRSSHQRHGASLAALVELAEQHLYVLVETTLFNAFFVPRALHQQHLSQEVPETTIEALHDDAAGMGTQLYQLYDGTLKLHGCKKLLWHRIPMDERRLQLLPENERVFPFAPPPPQDADDASSFDLSRVVDLSPYQRGSKNSSNDDADGGNYYLQRQQCAAQLLEQLQRDGFGLVRGTLPTSPGRNTADKCRAALRATRALLQEADESVRRSCLSSCDRARRGYAPTNVENFASLLGQYGQPNDLVRKFRVGPLQQSGDDGDDEKSAWNRHHANSLLQPNVWPTTEHWDEESARTFRSDVEAYYEAACRAAQTVVQVICDGLLAAHPELEPALRPLRPSNSDAGENDQTTSILTLLGYRTGTRHKGKNKGPLMASHTDVGVITLLLFDGGNRTCAKLQRRRTNSDGNDDDWVDVELPATVPRDDPIFVVNVADCLSELCQGKLPSTVHRVIAVRQSKVPRNCCALFVGLDPACELQIRGECMTYEEWRKRRITRSQNFLKPAAAASG